MNRRTQTCYVKVKNRKIVKFAEFRYELWLYFNVLFKYWH